jgi:hypothetical protein
MTDKNNMITRVRIDFEGMTVEFEGAQSFVETQLQKYEAVVFDFLADFRKNKPVHPQGTKTNSRKANSTRRTAKGLDNASQGKPKGRKGSGSGAVATLARLVEEDFFQNPATIGGIVTHCEETLARKFKANEFSGKLGRLVREKTLMRSKNSDNQYEYKNA